MDELTLRLQLKKRLRTESEESKEQETAKLQDMISHNKQYQKEMYLLRIKVDSKEMDTFSSTISQLLGPFLDLPYHVIPGDRDIGKCNDLDEVSINKVTRSFPVLDSSGFGEFDIGNISFVSLNFVELLCGNNALRFSIEKALEREHSDMQTETASWTGPKNDTTGLKSRSISRGQDYCTQSQDHQDFEVIRLLEELNTRVLRRPFASPQITSLMNATSSKNILEAAEDTIEELRDESKLWERRAQKLMLDLDILKENFSNQTKSLTDSQMELSGAQA
ncbi:metallo-dependent phosphatase-like protein [Tanacetum coccineum]